DASFVSCPLCSQLFAEPRELPCRHTVCLPCFRSLPADCSGGRSCPVCGQVCAVPPEQLTPDAKTSQMVQMYRMMTAAGGATPKEPQQLGTEAACSQLNCSSRSVSACGPVSRMSVCESHLQSELEQLRSKLSRLTESHRHLEPARKRIVSAKWRLEHDVQTVEELLGEMQEMLGQTKNSLCAEIAAIQEQVSGCLQNLEKVDRQVARAQAADAEQQTNEIFKAKSLLKNIDCEQPVIDCPNLQRRLHSLTLLLQAELSKLCYCSEPAVTASPVLSLNADVVHKSPYRTWLLSNRVERSTQRHGTRRLNYSTSSRGGASSSASALSRNSATAFTDAVASTAGKTGTPVAFGFPQSIESNSKVPWINFGQTNQSAQVPAETDEQVGVLPIRMSNSTGLQSCFNWTTRLTVCSNTTGFFTSWFGQVTSERGPNPLPAECLVVLRSDSQDSLLFIDSENSESRFYCKLTGWDQKPNDLCWVPGGPRLALASGRGLSGASIQGPEQLSFTARTGFEMSFGTSSGASVGSSSPSVEARRKLSALLAELASAATTASTSATTFSFTPAATSASTTAATSASTPAPKFSFAPVVTSASKTAATSASTPAPKFSFAPVVTSASTTAATSASTPAPKFSFAPVVTSASKTAATSASTPAPKFSFAPVVTSASKTAATSASTPAPKFSFAPVVTSASTTAATSASTPAPKFSFAPVVTSASKTAATSASTPAPKFSFAPVVTSASTTAATSASTSAPKFSFAPVVTSASKTAATSASTPAPKFSFAPVVTSASTTAATSASTPAPKFSFAPVVTSASTTAATSASTPVSTFAPASTFPPTPAAPAVVSVALADLSGCIVRSRRVDQLQRLTGLTANADKVFVAGVSDAHARLSVFCFSAESLELQSVIELSELPDAAAPVGLFGISLCKSGLLFACPMSSRLLHHCLETGVTSAFSDEKLGEGSAFCADDRGLVFVARSDSLKVHLPDGRLLQTVESSPSAPVSCIFASSDLIFVSHLQSTVARVYSRGTFFK
ncbi:hypothetical protein BOX15_Mlig024392g1, partial [Macrostomum lignano]